MTTAAATTTTSAIPIKQIPSPAPLAKKQPGLAVELLTAGSAACVADLFTFPLDTAKVRLQVKY